MILFDWLLILMLAAIIVAPPAWFGPLMLGFCAVLVVLPVHLDSAIRIKDWVERRRNGGRS